MSEYPKQEYKLRAKRTDRIGTRWSTWETQIAVTPYNAATQFCRQADWCDLPMQATIEIENSKGQRTTIDVHLKHTLLISTITRETTDET